jgi:hypothetical protein
LTGAVTLTLCAIGDDGDNNLDAGGAGKSFAAVVPVTFNDEDEEEETGNIDS